MATAAQLTTDLGILKATQEERHRYVTERLTDLEVEVKKVKWRLTGILVTLMLGVAALAGNAFILLANRP